MTTLQSSELILSGAFVATLATITVTDLDRRLIPNRVLIAAAILVIAITLVAAPASLPERVIAAVAAGGAFLAIALAYPGGMGMGDVKLAAVMGLYLGVAVAPALLVAFAGGALAGVILVVGHGLQARKRAIPFGPFLAAGGLAGLFVGDQMLAWYVAGL